MHGEPGGEGNGPREAAAPEAAEGRARRTVVRKRPRPPQPPGLQSESTPNFRSLGKSKTKQNTKP